MSELGKNVRQIVKASMYDDLLEKYKKLVIDHDILVVKHTEASRIFEEYRALVESRADKFRKIIDGIINDKSSEKPFSKDDLSKM